ncbi:hypothetical protein Ahy_A01g003626 isoform C [Arachis hypogaea]|uniref:Aldehyde oxidase/xanthine dehydrogenase second molybdopterin binding domain-containing protein n=1 Tax=Arachis hypogaea TaxID=3818 RepID=A0A445ETW5_ARAHY|nr:hypothetical protein Ahy_A01g003626 isoform C [Arachis hypogaea]
MPADSKFRVKLLLLLLQRLRVETRDGVTITERGKEKINRASSSPTIEKTRCPPSESRASSSSSPPPPSPPPRHPVHVFNSKIDEGRKALQRSQLLFRRKEDTRAIEDISKCIEHLWLVLRYAILNLEVIQAAISLAKQEGLLVSLDLASFEAGALVHVYTDGTVLVAHEGVEMGQGLHTKVAQITASAFNILLSSVFISDTSTNKVRMEPVASRNNFNSFAKEESRSAAIGRQQMVTEKGGNSIQTLGRDSVRNEEKTRRLLAGGEGLDQKIKKKRSIGAIGNRVVTGERDVKRSVSSKGKC